MLDIALVVLHYGAVNDTLECIDSIQKYVGTDKYKIVIVDNNSPDDSIEILNSKYGNSENIVIIHSNVNLGFAKGNNLGFNYIKNNYDAKFIVLLNNDICLIQNNFYTNVADIYEEYDFSVLGPMIVTKDGRCNSNPYGNNLLSEKDIKIGLFKQKISYYRSKFYVYKPFYYIKSLLKNLKNTFKDVNVVFDVSKPIKNIKLHGSFLIFSKDYIDKFDGLDSRTFLYFEEEILYLHICKNKMLSLYHPGITVYHKEDSSTNENFKNSRSKNMFITSNNMDSMCVYLKILNEYKNKN